jgi:hypothetical protein
MFLKERRVTWTFSYAYFEGMELLGHSPIPILKERRVTENIQVTPFLQNTHRRMTK